jgi:hypothetical protein
MPIAHILIEIYFAKKYNTKPKCARIGWILYNKNTN